MKITYIKPWNLLAVIVAAVLMFTTSCYKKEIIPGTDTTSGEGLEDWGTNTHSGDASPDYDIVFPQDKVNRIDLVISSDDWDAMLQDLTTNIGQFGAGGNNPPPPMYSNSDKNPAGPGGGETAFTPLFSAVSIFFNGIEWYNVGVRFKGNSSLRSSWQSGCLKLSFRFDFDEFESEYPEITDQRFYGFQKLAFSNNFEDVSFLHEKVAVEIFRDAGLKAPRTAYYRIYVDHGDGPIYFGLYTGVEIVEDTMLEDQFGSNSGKCYKPENEVATFAYGTFNAMDLDLKTNELIGDYSDIEALFSVLHSSDRISDTEKWKTSFESVFDVDNFMLWLATNTVIQNWDTYGVMNHNFYLYNNPSTNKIVWIPWDNNEALNGGKRDPLSFSMDEVTDSWPLIRYLMDQDEYKTLYETYLRSTIQGAFEPSKIKEKYQYFHNLISEYVIGADGEQTGYTFLKSPSDFTNALNDQCNHVDQRYSEVTSYLAK